MTASKLAALVAVGLAGAPTVGSALTVTQNQRANVYGLVQVGPNSTPVDVRQTGGANVVGIMQATPNNQVSVTQNGGTNRAFLYQFSPPLTTAGARGLIP